MSYVAAMEGVVARQDEAAAALQALAMHLSIQTAMLALLLVLVVGIAATCVLAAVLLRRWTDGALANHQRLMREITRPSPEQLGLSHAISDLDEAVSAIRALGDEVHGLRSVADAWLRGQGLPPVMRNDARGEHGPS